MRQNEFVDFIQIKERAMDNITVIGIDIAKNVIQIHGETAAGKVVLKKRVSREKFLPFMANKQKCLIGMEACGGSSYWARELIKLGFDVRLMSPIKVKRYTGHNKNDANDAEACAEAVTKKKMKFVPIKTAVQLEIQSIHRVRSYYVRQRTGLMNMIRGLLLEFGIAIRKSEPALLEKLRTLSEADNSELDENNRTLFQGLYKDLKHLDETIGKHTGRVKKLAVEDESCRRIQTIEGIGPLTATALIAKIGNGSDFKAGRDLSAYLGLVPKQHSSGETRLLLGISKHGDRYIRQLLIHGGRAVVQAAKRKNKISGLFCKQDKHSQWVRKLADRAGTNKASVAVANKNARMAIALLKNQTVFEPKLAH
jgi:transposase